MACFRQRTPVETTAIKTVTMKNNDTNKPSLNVWKEDINVDKKVVENGKVYINKKVHKEDETVEVPVAHEEVEVTRVAVNQYVDEAPQVRSEGDTTIIPVIKEVLVVEKKLMLVEEVHVTRHVVEKTEERTMPVRKEEVEVERYTKSSL